MPDVELAHEYIDRLRATADQTDHVDEEEELRDMAQLLERLTKRVEQTTGDGYQDRAKAIVRAFVALECLNDRCTSCGGLAGRCDCACHVQTATNHAALYTALGIEAP